MGKQSKKAGKSSLKTKQNKKSPSWVEGNKPTIAAFIILLVIILVLSSILIYKHHQNTASYYSQSFVNKYIEKLGDYKNLELNDEKVEITDEQVQAEIDAALEEKAERTTLTEGTAKKGSIAVIDYVGTLDGEEFEGGSATDTELELGSGQFIDGFEDGVIGMKVGEKKTIKLTFPKDYYESSLAGQDVEFEVTLKSLVKKTVPKLTDDLVQTLSKDSKTVKEYKKEIRDRLEKEQKEAIESNQEYELLNQVVEATEMKKDKDGKEIYPNKELNAIVDEQLKSYEEYAASSQMSLEDFVQQQTGSDLKSFKKQLKDSAKTEVKQRLVVSAIGRAEGIKIKNKDVKAFIKEFLDSMGYTEESWKQENGQTVEEQYGYAMIYEAVLGEKVGDRLIELAKDAADSKSDDKEKDATDGIGEKAVDTVTDATDGIADEAKDIVEDAADTSN